MRFLFPVISILLTAPALSFARVEICHFPPNKPSGFVTMQVSEKQIASHLSHGDCLGPCAAGCWASGSGCTPGSTATCASCLNPDGDACTNDLCPAVRPFIPPPPTPPVCGACVFAATGECSDIVEICHFPPTKPGSFRTLRISRSLLASHLTHGDCMGGCEAGCWALDSGCTGGDPGQCDSCPNADGDVCTTDTCRAIQPFLPPPATPPTCGGCNAANNTASCNDNDLCTHSDTCNGQGGCAGTAITCSSSQCTQRLCNGTSSCTEVPQDGVPCDDGDPCTHDDVCDPVSGCAGIPVTCESSPCVRRECNGTPSCTETPLTGSSCNDGELCTHTDTCNAQGACVGMPIVCEDDQCNTRSCNGGSLCTVTTKDGPCSDGDPCTHGETCFLPIAFPAAICQGGTRITCESNGCTLRECNGTASCTETPVGPGESCNDNDACTYGDTCTGGTCAGTPINCESDACATRSCNGTSTCNVTPAPAGTSCNDAQPCTYNDLCTGGGICRGASVTCNTDACNTRTCNGSSTCTVTPRTGNTCNDTNACTADDKCDAQGNCAGTALFCPYVPCYLSGTCDPATGQCSSATEFNQYVECLRDDCQNSSYCLDGECLCEWDMSSYPDCTGFGTGQPFSCSQCAASGKACAREFTGSGLTRTCCVVSQQCSPSCGDCQQCDYLTGSCEAPSSGRSAGCPCTADSQCYGDPLNCLAGSCQSGVCATVGTCNVQAGEYCYNGLCRPPCTSDAQCANPFETDQCKQDRCEDGRCVRTIARICGAPAPSGCSQPYGYCDPATGQCQTVWADNCVVGKTCCYIDDSSPGYKCVFVSDLVNSTCDEPGE